jgi:hypothetical protein
MMEHQPESSPGLGRIALRWKVLQGVGMILIGLGAFIDWPARVDASLPETSSFLVILGLLVGGAGLFAGFGQE